MPFFVRRSVSRGGAGMGMSRRRNKQEKEIDTMSKYTNKEIAESYGLWEEYVDPGNFGTKEEWEEMTVNDRLALMDMCGFND